MTEARKLKIEQDKLNKKIEASKFLVEQGVDIKKKKKVVQVESSSDESSDNEERFDFTKTILPC
jgi:hypothetical protein